MMIQQLIDFVRDNLFLIVVSTILIYVIQFYTNYFNRPSKIPGPLPLPIIGNLHQIGSDFPKAANNFYKRYGDLYEIYMGSTRTIMISRPDLVEKVWGPSSLKNTKFIMRNSYSEGIDELGIGTKGIVFNRNIERWITDRKFLVQSVSLPTFLRESINLTSMFVDEAFGYWKTIGEEGMQVEISEWMDALGADIVCKTATGKRTNSLAKLFNNLNINGRKSNVQGIWENGIDFAKSIHVYNESMSFMMLLPKFFRRNVPGIKSLNKKFLENRDWINSELQRLISERRMEIENTPSGQSLEPNILTLLLTTNTKRDMERLAIGNFDRPLTDDEAASIIREVFTGGLDTTSNSLAFIMFYIAKHRDVYLKMREEVLSVYGTLDNPDITYESYGKLKYIEAVINEGIRISPTVPIIGRASIEDVKIDGYTIVSDTTVHTNFYQLSNNPKYFEDPEKFDPDRFFINKESVGRYTFLPFGNGVRMCPGRAWAMVQMKTFFVKLLCEFDIESVDKNTRPNYVYATINRPVDIKICVKPRKN